MRLVIVSNRLPFTVVNEEDGPHFRVSSGGLTTGLWSYLQREAGRCGERPEFVWLGWPGATVTPKDEPAVRAYAEEEFKAVPVFLPEERMDRFYHGFCNRTLWPLFHYFPYLTVYEEGYWEDYKQVNRIYAEELLKVLRPDDLLWVHDYQLMLVPGMIRERFPDLPIGFFLHIPFPSYEVFRLLPRAWRVEIM
jgi:trehalose 6-phosphate synthase/phosphatase